MIYLRLFLTFLQIGAVSFGGGYAMISLIGEKCISNGWLTEDELLNMVAVSESTPGPIAVNMATFVGSSQGGVVGSLLATAGVVLPSFIIILLISAVLKNLLQHKIASAFLKGVRPAVVSLILSTAITMFFSQILNVNTSFAFDFKDAVLLALIVTIGTIYKRIFNKNASPIIMIIFSGVLGILFW